MTTAFWWFYIGGRLAGCAYVNRRRRLRRSADLLMFDAGYQQGYRAAGRDASASTSTAAAA